jgi:exonuclease III
MIGSMNVRGLTYLKLIVILEQGEFDILCLQETWVEEPAEPPQLKGYKLLEQRRPQGARGGLATYVRNSLHIEATSGNEYCLHAKIRLPNSQRVNIVNIYLPPTSSLAKRDITEAHATAQLENALEPLQPQLLTILCGDFNARTGTLLPTLDIPHPPRMACDSHVCPRAKWLLSLCTLFQLCILTT